MRGSNKPTPVCNGPDTPTSIWSLFARESVESSPGPEATSVCSVTSCATHATMPQLVPGGGASDHPCPPRDPWSLPGLRVIHYLTGSLCIFGAFDMFHP